MLVLSRKPGESIMIGDRIEVRIHKVDGDMVRLCIEAPREVAIYRKELFEEIRQTNREAAFKAKERQPLPKIDLVPGNRYQSTSSPERPSPGAA